MDRIGEWLSVLPPQMREPVLFAIPFFLLLLTIEWTAARKLERLENAAEPGRPGAGIRPGPGAENGGPRWPGRGSGRPGPGDARRGQGWHGGCSIGISSPLAINGDRDVLPT